MEPLRTLRFRMPKPQPYKWFPTPAEWHTAPFTALLEYELVYISTILLLAPPCFLLGFIIGRLWLLAI